MIYKIVMAVIILWAGYDTLNEKDHSSRGLGFKDGFRIAIFIMCFILMTINNGN